MSTPARILVTGGRDYTDALTLRRTLAAAASLYRGHVVFVHGDCPTGADHITALWVLEMGEALDVSAEPHPADWDNCAPNCPPSAAHRRWKKRSDIWHPGRLATYCPGAGPRRNRHIVSLGADTCIAAPGPGPSYGTRGCMKLARAAGIQVREVTR